MKLMIYHLLLGPLLIILTMFSCKETKPISNVPKDSTFHYHYAIGDLKVSERDLVNRYYYHYRDTLVDSVGGYKNRLKLNNRMQISLSPIITRKIDTIPVIMMLSDTSYKTNIDGFKIFTDINKPNEDVCYVKHRIPYVFWGSGYRVVNIQEGTYTYYGWINPTIQYLDGNKKPLNKNLVVWISSPVNQNLVQQHIDLY